MDLIEIFRAIGALAVVLSLIGAAVFLARRLGFVPRLEGTPFDERRLGIVESLALDPRRRLVLVRRDEAEHLILIGEGRETLVETLAAPLAHEAFAGVSVYGTSFGTGDPQPFSRAL